jgi:integrase
MERDLLDASPATALPKPAPEVSRDRVLSEEELRKIWQAAGKMGYPFGPVFQLLVLTGQRRDEVAKLRRSELDEANRVWSFQGARAKNHKAHVVHLSAQSLAVLAGVPRSSDQDLLFSTNGRTAVSGFSRAKARLDALSGVSDWRLHDLRRSFATHAVERLKAQPAVADKVLNHSAATIRGVQAVYQRAEFLAERESLLEAWGAFVEGLCNTNK